MIKGSIQQEAIAFIYIFAPNIGAPKYIKQIFDTPEGRNIQQYNNVREFNTPLSTMGRLSRQKINKETLNLRYMSDQINLTNIYRTSHSKATEYTFFSSTHRTFSRINYMFSQNRSL